MPGNIMEFAAYQRAFSTGLSQVYKDTLKAHPKTYKEFLAEETAQHFFDTEWSLSGLGAMPAKAIGAAVSTDKILQSPTKQFSLTPYALGVNIEYEAMRWDLYNVFKGLPEELGKSAVDRYNIVAHSIYANGFAAPSADYQIYSGENIFSATHVRLDGGTWSNQDPNNIALSYLGIQQAKIDLWRLVNERGRFGMVTPKKLLCAPEQAWVAETVLKSEYRPDNANNARNTVKGELDVYVSPYFVSANPWFVICDRENIRIRMRLGDAPKMTRDTDTRNLDLVMHTYCSFGVKVFDSRGAWGSTGAG